MDRKRPSDNGVYIIKSTRINSFTGVEEYYTYDHFFEGKWLYCDSFNCDVLEIVENVRDVEYDIILKKVREYNKKTNQKQL